MSKQQLALLAGESFGLPVEQVLPKIRQAGFDAFFAVWKDASIMDAWAAEAKASGLAIQSMHAPFRQAAVLWEGPAEQAQVGVQQLLDCIDSCAKHEVPVMVAHTYIGFADKPHIITDEGLERYYRLLRAAEGTGVTVAFENTEGEEFLDALFAHFGTHPNIGFCWDSGHERCYNRSRDLLGQYAKHVCATHLNDNLGISDANGVICSLDDLHLIPFDGDTDWSQAMTRLAATGFDGPLTFELKRRARPGRHEADRYMRISLEDYLADCYRGACRVAALYEQAKSV